MRLALIVKLSKDPDFSGQSDGLMDGRKEGKHIVPSGVNTDRAHIKILCRNNMWTTEKKNCFTVLNDFYCNYHS